jgi:diphosphomevalonate decarboxylase
VSGVLDAVRQRAQLSLRARVESVNDFPTASGLASSASGFAALTVAAAGAARLELSNQELSAMARSASASAARSIFGGWATLAAGAEAAEPLLPQSHWDVVLLVAITDNAQKSQGSTDGMNHTAATSPYYREWVEQAPQLFTRACNALQARDLQVLGECMEQSTWMMHGSMLAASPALVYLKPATLGAIAEVTTRRSLQVPAYFTTDAGPHVKVLTLPEHAATVADWLVGVPGVVQVIACRPGPGASRGPYLDCGNPK